MAALTLFAPQLLTGPAAMIGSARGTALVALVVGVPALLLSLRPARAGSQWPRRSGWERSAT
jgi:hypothetical protein